MVSLDDELMGGSAGAYTEIERTSALGEAAEVAPVAGSGAGLTVAIATTADETEGGGAGESGDADRSGDGNESASQKQGEMREGIRGDAENGADEGDENADHGHALGECTACRESGCKGRSYQLAAKSFALWAMSLKWSWPGELHVWGAAVGGFGGVHDEGEKVDEAPLIERAGVGAVHVDVGDDGGDEHGLEGDGGELRGHPEGFGGGDDVVGLAV